MKSIGKAALLGCVTFFTCAIDTAAGVAAGTSGTVVPTSVHLEGGNVYIYGAFQNPDGCTASNVAVLAPANEREMDRMVSIATTALASNRMVSMWFSGCAPTPWAPTAPRAVTMALHK